MWLFAILPSVRKQKRREVNLVLLQCFSSIDQKAEIITHSWERVDQGTERCRDFYAHGPSPLESSRKAVSSVEVASTGPHTPLGVSCQCPISAITTHPSPQCNLLVRGWAGRGRVCKPRSILANCNHRK